jgi:hypothetical protein
MLKIMMANIKKKGWLSLSSTTSAAVFSVGSCMIVIMILLGGINPCHAHPLISKSRIWWIKI